MSSVEVLTRRCLVAALVGAAGLSFAAAARAQGSSLAELAIYEGPDRMQRLIGGAKREGTLTVYGSTPLEDMNAITAAFEKKYGIKVRVWRGGPENVLQRGLTEARAGRLEADVFQTSAPTMEALHREKLLQEVRSPVFADLVPEAVLPHREWIGERLNIFAAAYNTNAVKPADAPKRYEDLTDPKFKGKLGVEADDQDWFATVVTEMGEDKGLALFREIVATNGMSVRNGHTLLTNLVASGEVPLALTVFSYRVDQLKSKGAPIEPIMLPPVVARVNGVGVARRAPHPHAALLFLEFMLTDAQPILLQRDFLPTNRTLNALPNIPIKFVNAAQLLDEGDKWVRLYREIILSRAR
jgi:ABC-type Fe3+ transport system substrate-binding protein